MKHIKNFSPQFVLLLLTSIIYVSCQKEINKQPSITEELQSSAAIQENGHLKQTKTFPATVAQKWQDLQLRFLRVPAGTVSGSNPYGRNGHRWFAYLGIALYESVVNGMPAYQSLDDQLIDMPDMPLTEPGKAYHWPTSANAALAFLTGKFFTTANTSADNVALISTLENELNNQYQSEVNAATFERSKNFGRAVAELIFAWSETDGYKNANNTFTPNGAAGSWKNASPNPTTMADPYWGKNRLFVNGSADGTASPLPPPYSTDPNSDYYKMVKEVYDVSQSLTQEQKETAWYFRDNPGFQAGTAYVSIFDQVMDKLNVTLDVYALAHVKTGIALAESMINCWKIKYEALVDRPTKYIREVLGHTGWSSLLSMPNHPDFPSGHSQNGGAFAAVMTYLFGDNYQFTIDTYSNLGMAPRTYNSFDDMAVDVGKSRVYAGIHYTYSCVEGKKQGEKIAQNVLNIVKFKKE